jgi:hypothetical protein
MQETVEHYEQNAMWHLQAVANTIEDTAQAQVRATCAVAEATLALAAATEATRRMMEHSRS